MFLCDTTLAKVVKGPLVNTVILDLVVGSMDSQTSIASGCLSSG